MKEILDLAVECARESGKIQREHYEKKIDIRFKGEINLVTEVDLRCQDRIIARIRERFPGDVIIAEEKENAFQESGNRWIIDPLDGTTNYSHGYPFFCTSIAYGSPSEVLVGAVYNPIFDELFTAVRGQGAALNGRPIRVSAIADLRRSLLSTGFPYDLPTSSRNNVKEFMRFIYRAQAVRRDGSAALNLSYVACGRFDGHWEIKLNAWDLAAGCLIVEEAGGRVTDLAGGVMDIYRGDVLATNGPIHESMLAVLKEEG